MILWGNGLKQIINFLPHKVGGVGKMLIILDSSKVKEYADDNFAFDENGREFSKWVENTVGKGEIACYEKFLLFPQCF